MAVGEEEAHSCWVHDALFHGETLFVVAARDFEDVAFELVADAVAWDFGSHTPVESIHISMSRGRYGRARIAYLSMKTRRRRSSSISMSF